MTDSIRQILGELALFWMKQWRAIDASNRIRGDTIKQLEIDLAMERARVGDLLSAIEEEHRYLILQADKIWFDPTYLPPTVRAYHNNAPIH